MSESDEFVSRRSRVTPRQRRHFIKETPGRGWGCGRGETPSPCFGAVGMYKSGWDELSRIFPWVASRFSDVSDYRFEVLVADVIGDMAYSVGYKRFTGSVDGRPVKPITVRATHIYRREDGEWEIVQRHGDNPPPDQSPPMSAR
jgi:ketosteroid isomerase-like protein